MQKQSFPMESITTTNEEFHNILNELLEFPSKPVIGEPDVILVDGNNEDMMLSNSENYSQELHNTPVSTKG